MNKRAAGTSSEDAVLQRLQKDMREQADRDASLDEALGFTFPASDPVALSYSGAEIPAPKQKRLRMTIDFFKGALVQHRS